MKQRLLAIGFFLTILSTVLLEGCSGCGPLVGRECALGQTQCGLLCYDLTRDFANCGACGVSCNPGQVCRNSMCISGNLDGSQNDGSQGDAGEGDGGEDDGGTDGGDGDAGDGGDGDAGDGDAGDGDAGDGGDGGPDGGGCPLGTQLCPPDGCVAVDSDIRHCGACGNACASNEVCELGSSAACTTAPDNRATGACNPMSLTCRSTCKPICTPPTAQCGMACVNITNDPLNCGTCGNRCMSGICQNSDCQDATPGHIVIIGHDFSGLAAPNNAMQYLVGNSVFLKRKDKLGVLMYTRHTNPIAIGRVNAAISLVAAGTRWGNPVTSGTADPVLAGRDSMGVDGGHTDSEISEVLENFDVFFIHSQPDAQNSDLSFLGALWSSAIFQFVANGKVVVLLDGPTTNLGTYKIIEPTTLFNAVSKTAINGSTVYVPNDAISDSVVTNLVTTSYNAFAGSVAFNTVFQKPVVRVAGSDTPVVIHVVTGF